MSLWGTGDAPSAVSSRTGWCDRPCATKANPRTARADALSQEHLASFAGVCSGSTRSADERQSRRTRRPARGTRHARVVVSWVGVVGDIFAFALTARGSPLHTAYAVMLFSAVPPFGSFGGLAQGKSCAVLLRCVGEARGLLVRSR
jgi:hypothetical protein